MVRQRCVPLGRLIKTSLRAFGGSFREVVLQRGEVISVPEASHDVVLHTEQKEADAGVSQSFLDLNFMLRLMLMFRYCLDTPYSVITYYLIVI